jgi:ribonuclease T2
MLVLLALLPSQHFTAPATAQAFQCRTDGALPAVPRVSQPRDEPTRIRPVTGYTLALTWSPEFCRTRKTSARDAIQCSGSHGDFGFILHGLWPDTRGPDYPQYCAPSAPSLTPEIARRSICMTPSPRLQNHEWLKHGTCMVKRPQTYFRISRVLFNAVQFPDLERMSYDPLTVGILKQAMADANPGLRPDMMILKSNRRGWLEEIHICLAANFRPARCPAYKRRQKDDTPVKIWRGM